MDEKKLMEMIEKEADRTAPDMDALWNRIESTLTEKEQPKKRITMKTVLSLVTAAAALLILIPAAYINMNGSKQMTDFSHENTAAEQIAAADECAVEETTGHIAETNEPISYDSLDLAPAENTEIACTGSPRGSDFFTEDDVLEETEVIVDAVVDRVYASPDNSCIYYELTAKEAYGTAEKSLTVTSCSPYEMKSGREYLIPLKSAAGELQTVFDNAPQIELTRDGGVVFHNGWKSLDNGVSESLLYPGAGAEDYFYDRMKLSYGGTEGLVAKWKSIHGND